MFSHCKLRCMSQLLVAEYLLSHNLLGLCKTSLPSIPCRTRTTPVGSKGSSHVVSAKNSKAYRKVSSSILLQNCDDCSKGVKGYALQLNPLQVN